MDYGRKREGNFKYTKQEAGSELPASHTKANQKVSLTWVWMTRPDTAEPWNDP